MSGRRYISPDAFKTTTRDNFRKLLNKYWFIDSDGIIKYYEDATSTLNLDGPARAFLLPKKTNSEIQKQITIKAESVTGIASEVMFTVTSDKTNYVDVQQFSDDILNLFKNPSTSGREDYFYDESFQYTIPNIEETTGHYNFFNEKYELITTNAPETVIPNFYNLALINRDEQVSEDIYTHTLLYDGTGTVIPQNIITDVDKGKTYEQYYNSWSDIYPTIKSENVNKITQKALNIISSKGSGLTQAWWTNTDNQTDQTKRIPFSINLKITPEKQDTKIDMQSILKTATIPFFEIKQPFGNITDISNNLSITPLILSHLNTSLRLSTNDSLYSTFGFSGGSYIEDTGKSVTLRTTDLLEDGFGNNKSVIKLAIDIATDNQEKIGEKTVKLDNKLLITTKVKDDNSSNKQYDLTVQASDDYQGFFDVISDRKRMSYFVEASTNFASLLQDESNAVEARGFNRFFYNLDGGSDKSYNETIGYRVLKYRGDKVTAQPVQEIYVPHSNYDARTLNLIDSQVRYGQEYTYDIYALKYLYGLRYKYLQNEAPKENFNVETVQIANEIIGYKVGWVGASNLFDDWKDVAIGQNAGAWPLLNLFRRYFPTVLSNSVIVRKQSTGTTPMIGTDEYNFPNFKTNNRKFFTPAQLNDLVKSAWVTKPTILDQNGAIKTYLSWSEIWPYLHVDANTQLITADTPLNGLNDLVYGLLRSYLASVPSQQLDPLASLKMLDIRSFGIREWLTLFFGVGNQVANTNNGFTGAFLHYNKSTNVNTAFDSFPFERIQAITPAHHVFAVYGDREYFFYSGFAESGFNPTLTNPLSTVKGGPEAYSNHSHLEPLKTGDSITTTNSIGYIAKYKMQISPSTRIVQVPYVKTTSAVLSRPPITPEISFTSYRAVNDQVLISFGSSNSTENLVPVALEASDSVLLKKHYLSQGKDFNDPTATLEYKTDDIPGGYQIYRIESAPQSYQDFAGHLIETKTTRIPSRDKIIRATSVSYLDKIRQNVKYYYTFRTVDTHGNFSNPTSIFEVELVDDGGAIYPLINIYRLPEITDQTISKPFKKLFQILPTLEQVTPKIKSNITDAAGNQIQSPNDITNVQLGSNNIEQGKKIWENRFKVRLISKKTGKKIDFNITFEKNDERKET